MKTSTDFHSFLARTATTLLVMMLTMNVQTARADEWPEYISEVKLIGGSKTETNTLKTQYEGQGWTVVDYDLNKGCGSNSDFIFLIYKKASRNSTNQGYITDFYVTYHSNASEVTNLSTTVNHNYKEYTLCPYEGGDNFVSKKGDLNSNAGGKYIHLYYTKKNFDDKRAVTDITFDDSSDYALEWNDVGGNDEGRPADLNKGCGSSSPYIYMHLTTATKTNRPTADPVMQNLVYNGAAQQLVKTPATIAVGTMYYSFSATGSFTTTPSRLTAKNAGNYTVYYYAGADGVYGDQSATHHQTATIAKSPNDQVTVVVEPCYGSDKTISPSCAGNNLSSGAITYQYATAENGTYTSTVPTTPGTYWVRASIAGDNNCDAFTTASKAFMKVAWKGNGTAASPLLISSTTDLDQLATAVNGGNNFQGIVFKVTNDIDYSYTTEWNSNSQENNFTPIGNGDHPFCGTFDGDGHIISGIRADSRSSSVTYGGLFGYISNGDLVKDITLADTRIYINSNTGSPHLGGIAGKADGNSTITNCHVKDDVALFLSGNNQHGGGIVGYLIGTVSHCTSAATLSFSITNVVYDHGGITGYCKDATLTDNFVFGATLNDRIQYIGAIAGLYTNTNFARNYYAHCTKGTATTGFGCNGADITDNDGAVPLFSLTPAEGISATATATVTYGGNGYYKQGTTVTLSGGLDGTPPIGYLNDGYSVNGGAISGNTFRMPAADVTVTIALETLYTLTLADGITVSTPPASSDGETDYYKAGTTVTLSGGLDGTPPIGYLNAGYSVNGGAISGNTFRMPAADVTVTIALETLYTLTLPEGITVVTPPTSSDGETDYYKAGTNITLSGGMDDATTDNPYCYIVDGFCLSGNTFTMPAANATVVAAPVPTDWDEQGRDGSSWETAYLIYTTDHLDLLAQRVNDGTADYADKYFRLMNDLNYAHTTAWDDATSQETNYTPIGIYNRNFDRPFLGHFLGDGHTISGIRIYRGGYESIDGSQGLFGQIGANAEVSGVTIADARITGLEKIGSIVGTTGGGTVTDCHVGADVALHAVRNDAKDFGGIVGANSYRRIYGVYYSSTVSNCTSAVTITVKDGISNLKYFGGIAGFNQSFIKNCRAEGAVVPAVTDAGAIVGYDNNTILTDNTYHSCLVGNNAFNIGVGYRVGVNGDMDGAILDASALRLDDCRDNTALIAAYADPANHTANDGTAPDISSLDVTLHGRTLYMDGDWNTLCLPFDVSDFSSTPLAGATVMTLDNSAECSTGYDAATKTLTLDFVDANTIEAGKPYIVKKISADASTLTYRATDGTGGFEGEDHSHLVDGKPTKKWCTSFDQKVDGVWFCEFMTSVPVSVTGYTLTTGNDLQNSIDRNPAKWSLQAKVNSTDVWTVIDSRNSRVNRDDELPHENSVSKDYDIAADLQGTYQYFRFEVKENNVNEIMELGELTLQGTVSSIVSPTFYGVTVNAATPTAITSLDETVSFQGSYSRYKTGGEDKSLLFLGADNTLYYPSTAMTIGAFRAWFQLNGITAGDLNAPNGINAFVLNFDNDEASGIVDISEEMVNGQSSMVNDQWYSIDGRKLSGKPTAKGIYIHNGRKVRL